VVSADLLYPTASTSSAVKTPENAEEGPDAPQQADGNIQMEYNLYSPSIQAVPKYYM
jgi:hypothetical protein